MCWEPFNSLVCGEDIFLIRRGTFHCRLQLILLEELVLAQIVKNINLDF